MFLPPRMRDEIEAKTEDFLDRLELQEASGGIWIPNVDRTQLVSLLAGHIFVLLSEFVEDEEADDDEL